MTVVPLFLRKLQVGKERELEASDSFKEIQSPVGAEGEFPEIQKAPIGKLISC